MKSILLVLVLGALMGALTELALRSRTAMAGGKADLGGDSTCPGDLNGDRIVNGADLTVLLATFGSNCNNIDADLDGFTFNQGDCDDANPSINPAAVEVCDGVDNDCNGLSDEGPICPGLPNASGVCQNGMCTTFCDPGFSNCDSNIFNGCETNVLTSIQHCSACNVPCPTRPNTVITCVNGVCQYACAQGFANCDNNIMSNGCEVNVFNSVANCGTCGHACTLTAQVTSTACFTGTCIITGCAAGFEDRNLIYEDGCEAQE